MASEKGDDGKKKLWIPKNGGSKEEEDDGARELKFINRGRLVLKREGRRSRHYAVKTKSVSQPFEHRIFQSFGA